MSSSRLRQYIFLISIIVIGAFIPSYSASVIGASIDIEIRDYSTSLDTIPIKDSYQDFISSGYRNPFDITPDIINQTVEYDFETGQYIVMEKIGDEYYRHPTYLTMSEYLEWQEKKAKSSTLKKAFWHRLSRI